MVSPLESCSNLQLQVVKNVSEAQCVFWTYDQKNVTLSRKFILPFLANHFEAKARKFKAVNCTVSGLMLY